MFASLIFFLLFLLLVILIIGTLAAGGILAAPWVPIRSRDVNRLLKLAKLKPWMVLYDLGSGDGRLIIAAARDYQAQAIGYEIAVLPYLLSYFKIILAGLWPRAKVKYGNFYRKDLSRADIITTFLSPRAMKKLKVKLKREVKAGSLLISYVFRVPGWRPLIIDRPTSRDLPIYVYKI